MNIIIGILNVPKYDNKHDLIHFLTPITIGFDLTSFNCFVSIIKPFALDLRGSNFWALIGFEQTVIRQTQYGMDIPKHNK